MSAGRSEAALFVVFGATGDLMERKLLPALLRIAGGPDARRLVVLGVARTRDHDDRSYRDWACRALDDSDAPDGREWCLDHVHFETIGEGGTADFVRLAERIRALEAENGLPGNRVLYLATPPSAFTPTIQGLGAAGLDSGSGWTRLVVEKPFGRDLASATELNEAIHACFDETQVYRIDHYLGKETVQNLLVLRLANMVFESVWNRDRIERVFVTVAESLGLEGRSRYYDQAGAVRDMIQSHLTQLLTLVAMEVPAAFEADAIRSEKVKVLRSAARIRATDAVLGQYAAGRVNGELVAGYLEEPDIPPSSRTETFAAIRVEIDNWRWKGVPFYLRTGKRLPRRLTQIAVQFRRPPVSLFTPARGRDMSIHRNVLAVTLQPDEGFELRFEVKQPGEPFAVTTHGLDFYYAEAYGRLASAYETLLGDILQGDQTLFVRGDEVEAAWRLYEPLLAGDLPVHPYESGTWGPTEADRLLGRSSGGWLVLEPREQSG